MEKPINESFIKLSSKVPLPFNIDLGDDVTVKIGEHPFIFNVVKKEENDNQDGTIDVTYVAKALSE